MKGNATWHIWDVPTRGHTDDGDNESNFQILDTSDGSSRYDCVLSARALCIKFPIQNWSEPGWHVHGDDVVPLEAENGRQTPGHGDEHVWLISLGNTGDRFGRPELDGWGFRGGWETDFTSVLGDLRWGNSYAMNFNDAIWRGSDRFMGLADFRGGLGFIQFCSSEINNCVMFSCCKFP